MPDPGPIIFHTWPVPRSRPARFEQRALLNSVAEARDAQPGKKHRPCNAAAIGPMGRVEVSIPVFTESSSRFPLRAAAASRGRKRGRAASVLDPVELALDPERLVQLGEALGASASLRGLERTLALARALVDLLYGGDASAWRLRSPKTLPLRTLARSLGTTPAALCRALAVHEVWSRAAEGRPWSQLSASHYRAVQNVDVALQVELLEEAWREGLSAEAVRRRVAVRGERREQRGGRLPDEPVARLLTRLERELSAADAATISRTREELERRVVHDLASRSEAIARRCLNLARELRRR